MAKGLVSENSLNSIAEAINVLNGTEGTYYPSEMGAEIIDAIPTETASGNPIHITNAAAYPAESVVTTLEPIQDLHGYDKPWPAGGGVNKFDNVWLPGGGYWYRNTPNTKRVMAQNLTPVEPSTTYTISWLYASGLQIAVQEYNNTDTASETNPLLVDSGWKQVSTYTFTTNENTHYIWLQISSVGYTEDVSPTDAVAMNVQLELGSTATTYEPYSNICPITGYTGVELTRTGKNLFDKDNTESGYLSSDGSVVSSDSFDHEYILIEGGQTYTVSGINYNGGPYSWWYDKSMIPISSFARHNNGTFTAPINAKYMGINAIVMSNTGHDIDTIQVELGSTATTYEPYQATTYSVTFPTEAGTVYGGEVDLVNGVLRVTDTSATYDGSADENWSNRTVGDANLFEIQIPNINIPQSTLQVGKCNLFPWLITLNADNTYRLAWSILAVRYDGITLTEWKNMLAETPLQITYPLATPLEIPLTPQVINLFKGENNIFADNGTTEVQYKVDLQTYIEELKNSATRTLNVSPLSLNKADISDTDLTEEEPLSEEVEKTVEEEFADETDGSIKIKV